MIKKLTSNIPYVVYMKDRGNWKQVYVTENLKSAKGLADRNASNGYPSTVENGLTGAIIYNLENLNKKPTKKVNVIDKRIIKLIDTSINKAINFLKKNNIAMANFNLSYAQGLIDSSLSSKAITATQAKTFRDIIKKLVK